MNAERIRELADVIERQPDVGFRALDGFNMEFVNHPCGTPSCIVGWARSLWGSQHSWLSDILDLVGDRAGQLIVPNHSYAHYVAHKGEPGHITASHAAAVLRHLAATGEVDWTVQPESAQEDPRAQEAIEELIEESREFTAVEVSI